MNELDKYFEKARNTNPIYEKDDAKKLLYGKLGDGGIATNLYNKIKVYPMITALITSVATVATIALFSLTSPNEKSATPITTSLEEIVQSPQVKPIATTESEIEPEEFALHEKNTATNQEVHEKSDESNNKNFKWTEEKIDLKTVNALKLTKDELANLGIVINENNFKINAFDKYTYTINQDNQKTRDYYSKDKDSEAYPTPAMVTTSSGFKTLTLFKKGNVEATVDRYQSNNNEDDENDVILNKEYSFDKKINISIEAEKKSDFIAEEENYTEYIHSHTNDNDSTQTKSKIDKPSSMEIELNGKKVELNFKELLKNATNPDSLKLNIEKFIKLNFNEKELNDKNSDMGFSIKLNKSNDGQQESLLDLNYEVENIKGDESLDSNKLHFINIRRSVYNNDDEILNENNLWNEKIDNGNKKNSIMFELLSYNINELIPIEISFDGKTTDFIVWYEANDEFLNKLPKSQLDKINPELLALKEQQDHCKNEPVEKEKTVMDVWSGCSGAIKDMHVFPNPAISNSNIEFDLEESRVISIAIYDLSGKLIKRIADNLNLSKGQITESLNLNGVKSGLYYVVVKSDKNEQALQRIIIE